MKIASLNRFLSPVIALLLGLSATATHAATFTVSNASASGAGSFAQAFADANAAAGADTIVFDSVFFATPQTVNLAAELAITVGTSLTITGPGPHLLTVSGGGARRLFYMGAGVGTSLSISGMTLTGGNGTGSGVANTGGAIAVEPGIIAGNSATLSLTNCIIRNNGVTGNGASMRLNGTGLTLTVTDCLFANNSTSAGFGGAIFMSGFTGVPAIANFTNTTFLNNTASSSGGGLQVSSNTRPTFKNCSFIGNTANNGGAVNTNQGNILTFVNCTLTGNTAATAGGGIAGSINTTDTTTINLRNTLVAGNTAPTGPNLAAGGTSTTYVSTGGNLVGDNTGAQAPFNTAGNPNGNNDYVGTSGSPIVPFLSPPGNYGGTAWTRAYLSGSGPGMNQGVTAPSTGLTTDARGAARIVGIAEDIGAYERSTAPTDFTATSLPPGKAGDPYSYVLATGTTGYIYLVSNGSLPAPLTLTNSGGNVTIAGTPAANGTSTFRISISDGGLITTVQYQLVVGAGAGPVAVAPTVTTATQSAVTHNSATLGGDVTADGGASVTERGIVWGLGLNPTTTADTKVQNGTGTGAFSGTVNGLPSNTTIHVRAYATNSVDTSYGADISFTTLPAPVAVTSLNRVNATPTNAGTVNWTLTFASAVTGLTASNLSLTGAASAGSVVGTPTITSGGGLTWNIPVTTGSTDGTLTLNLANATGLSATISTSLPFAGQSYTMDKTPPTVVSVTRLTPSGQNTNLTTLTFRVTYSEPVTLNPPETARFQVVPVNGSTIVGTVTGVTGTGDKRDVTVNLTSGLGEFKLRVID